MVAPQHSFVAHRYPVKVPSREGRPTEEKNKDDAYMGPCELRFLRVPFDSAGREREAEAGPVRAGVLFRCVLTICCVSPGPSQLTGDQPGTAEFEFEYVVLEAG